jgi:uncharacterized membrane protein
MSLAQSAPSLMARSGPRWLLLSSLALNLFFVGVAVAMAVRAPHRTIWDRNVFVRVDRIAATLPQADAAVLRQKIQASRDAIAAAQSDYRADQDSIRDTLRKEPFDATAMRDAMVKTRAARQHFDQIIQGVFASAAEDMSPAGRHALADWPPRRNTARNIR